jgi:hypothetical protein
MSTFIERLVLEQSDLNEKKSKLEVFVQSDAFLNIDKEQQALLRVQLNAMATYSECLNQRLIQIYSKEPQTSN